MSIEQEYRRVRKNLRERIRYWEKTKGFRYSLPPKPETITQESISELESLCYKNIPDIADLQTQYVRTHDVRAHQLSEFNYSGPAVYEWGLKHRSEVAASPSLVEQFPVLEEIYREEHNATNFDDSVWHTEDDYYNNDESITETPINRTKDPVVEENLIDNFINSSIENLSDYDQYIPLGKHAPSHEPCYFPSTNNPSYHDLQEGWARQYSELIADNIRWAFQRHPNPQAFYNYLRQPEIAQRLSEAAHRIYADSNPMSNNNRDINLREIIEILNGSQLSDEEWDELRESDTGVYGFDFYDWSEEV